jgi:hypothetical protein
VSLPVPKPGLVIRYSYLWWDEHKAGQEEGRKDRPCAVILTLQNQDGHDYVAVAPITHTPPRTAEDGLELPASVKAHLGLDGERSWIILTEVNRFLWPGPDLRALPGTEPPAFTYGFLPPRLFSVIRDRIVQRVRSRLLLGVKRTD